jgi:hypothetical protein
MREVIQLFVGSIVVNRMAEDLSKTLVIRQVQARVVGVTIAQLVDEVGFHGILLF